MITRRAEKVLVRVSEPWPRWVDIEWERHTGMQEFSRMSIKDAEGLLWALGKALAEAESVDREA